jgi:Tol biopolymer transport system component
MWTRTGLRNALTLVGLVAALLVALVLPGVAPVARADFAGRNGRLVFQRNGDLYTVLPNGTGLQRLTTQGGATPRWSPDGKQIVFVRGTSIWIMSADGSHQHKVADGWGPTFSPDGKSLAFIHVVHQPQCPPDQGVEGPAAIQHVTVMPLSKPAAARSLYSASVCQYADYADWITSGLRWSPDGQRLLFDEHYSSDHAIAVSIDELTIANKNLRYVRDLSCVDESGGGGVADCPHPNLNYNLNLQPDYSPDGNAVVFVSDLHQSGNSQLWAVARTGKSLTYVGGDSNVNRPVWSPNGKQWAYVQRTPGAVPVIKVTAASLTPQPATTVVVNGAQVDWQPLH